MKLCFITCLSTVFCIFCFIDLNAQDDSLSNRVANYDMDIELNVENKSLLGTTQFTWKNISQDTITELFFHMYYNAFKNSESTFFKVRGIGAFLGKNIDKECGWGWTNISEFLDKDQNDLIINAKYVQPDDNNLYDQTVLKIDLVDPILPGDSKQYNFKWQAKIPKTMPRTGYNKEFYFFAQWFPKVGVYEPEGMRFSEKGQWNCHQYHSSGEYYSDFGSYNVKMTVPDNYIVASSGKLQGQEKKGNKKIWHFNVEDVIDFTWSCSPHYVINNDSYKETDINLYTYQYKVHLKERYFPTIKFCLEYLDKHLGEYPYPTLTIIDPPIHGMFTGGMEYPTLITSLSFCFFPKGIKTPETLVVHEFIHQYFMQMVATHEAEETWMDEGITSYYEGRILDAYMGSQTSTIDVVGFKCGNKEFNRAEFFSTDNTKIAPNSIKSWQYRHGGYGDIAYNKTALWLQTMEYLVGLETMDQIMKNYFDAWKFKHPYRQDFIDIVNNTVKKNCKDKFPDGMDWYFDQVLYGTDVCDYKVKSIVNIENEDNRGFFEDLDNCNIKEVKQKKYNSKVIIQREEGIQLPIEILVFYEDGKSELFKREGIKRSEEIAIQSDLKIVSAIIDPERKIMLDKNWINNSMTIEPTSSGIRGVFINVLSKVQELMDAISFVI